MSFAITHRGQALNQRQLEAIAPVINDLMHQKISQSDFKAACDAALVAAGVPLDTAEPHSRKA